MAIDAPAPGRWRGTASREAVALAALVLGALLLAGEAAVHAQQYSSVVHGVRWIGPLFLANTAACVAAIAGLVHPRTRRLAELLGVVVSAGALAGLAVSYGHGLFGWYEAGFRTAISFAVITELAAVIFLSTALAATTASDEALPTSPAQTLPRHRSSHVLVP
jgi:hypothetical protein